MSVWRLELNGVTKTLAEWKATGVVLRTQSLGIDLLSFQAPRTRFDDADYCAFGETARLFCDDVATTTWFEGRRQIVPAQASPEDESQRYTFANAWEWLETNVFQQPWYGGVFTSHIIVIGSVGFNIRVVLDYAKAQGCPLDYFAADLAELPVTPPANEVTGKTCAAVIMDLLRFAPDTVAWFDYSTSPPLLRFAKRGALSAVPLRMPDAGSLLGTQVHGVRLISREDLQVPSVKICFETIVTVDEAQRLVPSVDIYPPGATGREDGALSDTVILQGPTTTTVSATLLCDTIDINSLAFWKKVCPILSDPRIKPDTLSIAPGTVPGTTSASRLGIDGSVSLLLPRFIVEGQAEDWMTNPDDSAVAWQGETVQAKFLFELYDSASDQQETTKIHSAGAQLFTVNLTATNAPVGVTDYQSIETVEEGDPAVIGLAEYLYDSLNPLHYEATFALLEPECTGVVRVGHVCNLFGARAAYETMRALVQSVAYSIDDGRTEVMCGPPRHLSITDILALLRANRLRRRWTNPATQNDGQLSSGQVILGRGMPNTNTVTGGDAPKYLAVKSGVKKITLNADLPLLVMDVNGSGGQVIALRANDPNGSINIRLEDCNGKVLMVREVAVCVAGNERKMMVIGSAPYI